MARETGQILLRRYESSSRESGWPQTFLKGSNSSKRLDYCLNGLVVPSKRYYSRDHWDESVFLRCNFQRIQRKIGSFAAMKSAPRFDLATWWHLQRDLISLLKLSLCCLSNGTTSVQLTILSKILGFRMKKAVYVIEAYFPYRVLHMD